MSARAFFRTYFRKVRELLAHDGVAIVHTMGRMGGPGTTDKFMQKHLFPGGYLPALSEIVAASEQEKLIMADCETWRMHYVYTLRDWYERLKANRDGDCALYEERLLSAVPVLSRGLADDVPRRADVRLPDAIHARPGSDADHAQLHVRGGGAAWRKRRAAAIVSRHSSARSQLA